MNPQKYYYPRNYSRADRPYRLVVLVIFLGYGLGAIYLGGCSTLRSDARAEIKAAGEIFAATVNVLTEFKAQGQLGDDEIDDIDALIHLGERYLQRWHDAVQAGERDADAVTAFRMILEQLQDIRSDHVD